MTPATSIPAVLKPGDQMPGEAIGPLSRTDFVRYAGASGDLNPIHHDEEFARRAGQPSVFAMGMLPAGTLAIRFAAWVGTENVRQFGVRFVDKVWPGDTLTFAGEVTDVAWREDQYLASIRMSVARHGGDQVLTATALVSAAQDRDDRA